MATIIAASTTPSAQALSEWRGLRESDIPLLSYVQETLLSKSTKIPDWREDDTAVLRRFRDQVRKILMPRIRLEDLEDTTQRIADALAGVGLLQPFLRDPAIEEVYVRGAEVAYEKGGEIVRLGDFAPSAYWENLIRRVAEVSGQRPTPQHPAVLVDLPGGQRFTGMLPPLMDRPAINIRLYGAKTMANLRKLGAFSQHTPQITGSLDDIPDPNLRTAIEMIPSSGQESPEHFIAWLVAAQAGNILISGEFSSGKTTLLNFISQYIPADTPVAVLETFRELQLAPQLFQMRAIAPSENRTGEERVATMDWVLNVIYTRSNPGTIILGEIVSSGEAMQYIKAANLGRRAYATIHGFDCRSALGRLEQLALGDQPDLGLGAVRQMVAAGVDVVVHMSKVRNPNGVGSKRFVAAVSRIAGLDENNDYCIEHLYSGWLSEPEDPIRAAWEALL